MKTIIRTSQEWGAIGGYIGGRRRAAKLSAKRRREIARMGGKAKARNSRRKKA